MGTLWSGKKWFRHIFVAFLEYMNYVPTLTKAHSDQGQENSSYFEVCQATDFLIDGRRIELFT